MKRSKKSEGPRSLPENPDELDAALRPYQILVRPVVGGISRGLSQLGADPFDADEKASGELSGSAFLYEYGSEISAKVLLALWCVGVIIPRVPQIVEHYQNNREPKRQLDKEISETEIRQRQMRADVLRSAEERQMRVNEETPA